MKLKTGFEIFLLDTLPRWLMYFVGVLLFMLVVAQIEMYQDRKLERTLKQVQHEQQAMNNELKDAKERQSKLEEEMEHQKLIRAIAKCESNFRHENTWGDGGKSYGMFQFKLATFRELAGKMGFKNAKWKDAGHQYIVADWAIRNGHGDLWTCYRKVMSNEQRAMRLIREG